ncbi:MAG TPA: hypothetical protein VE308_05365 [Nitrososphaera sp.]|jgi:hypothetical protein|nr:hypothetical protein [Nitrososphaera sp.]
MIATKKMAVLMAATILAAGISIAPFLGAEAESINTTRSNIKSSSIAQQNADQVCTNQAQGQGGQQAVPNPEQTTIAERGDPVPDIDVKVGKNPGGSAAGAGISSEGDPTVDAEQSNECSIAMEQTVEQNGDTEDFSTNEWTE